MRIASAALLLGILGAQSSLGGDKELLDKFKRQNEQGREKLVAEIKTVLEKVDALEKTQPVQAILLLQETRDRMLQNGKLTAKEDRDLAEPLWERIKALRLVVRGKKADELRLAVAEFKSYQAQLNEEFARVRNEFVRPGKEPPAGEPAFLALANGTQLVGWLNEPPVYVVNAIINDEPRTFAPGTVVGLQTPRGFYLYDRTAKQFSLLPGPEFFLTAVMAYPPARSIGFWVPSTLPELPPGFFKKSMGATGAALFSRSTAMLMATWGGPGGQRPEAAAARDTTTTRIYRDVILDLMVQDVFSSLKKEDQNRFRDVILNFLDRRPSDTPLNAEEIVQFSDTIAGIYPERRADALTYARLLNRLFEQNERLQKK